MSHDDTRKVMTLVSIVWIVIFIGWIALAFR